MDCERVTVAVTVTVTSMMDPSAETETAAAAARSHQHGKATHAEANADVDEKRMDHHVDDDAHISDGYDDDDEEDEDSRDENDDGRDDVEGSDDDEEGDDGEVGMDGLDDGEVDAAEEFGEGVYESASDEEDEDSDDDDEYEYESGARAIPTLPPMMRRIVAASESDSESESDSSDSDVVDLTLSDSEDEAPKPKPQPPPPSKPQPTTSAAVQKRDDEPTSTDLPPLIPISMKQQQAQSSANVTVAAASVAAASTPPNHATAAHRPTSQPRIDEESEKTKEAGSVHDVAKEKPDEQQEAERAKEDEKNSEARVTVASLPLASVTTPATSISHPTGAALAHASIDGKGSEPLATTTHTEPLAEADGPTLPVTHPDATKSPVTTHVATDVSHSHTSSQALPASSSSSASAFQTSSIPASFAFPSVVQPSKTSDAAGALNKTPSSSSSSMDTSETESQQQATKPQSDLILHRESPPTTPVRRQTEEGEKAPSHDRTASHIDIQPSTREDAAAATSAIISQPLPIASPAPLPPPTSPPRSLFSSNHQFSPNGAYTSRISPISHGLHRSGSSSSAIEKAPFMSPIRKPSRGKSKLMQMDAPHADLSTPRHAHADSTILPPSAVPLPSTNVTTDVSDITIGRYVNLDKYASLIAMPSHSPSSSAARRLPIKQWSRPRVLSQRQRTRFANPTARILAAFPYARTSLVPFAASIHHDRSANAHRLPVSLMHRRPSASHIMRIDGDSVESAREREERRLKERMEQLQAQAAAIRRYTKRKLDVVDGELDIIRSFQSITIAEAEKVPPTPTTYTRLPLARQYEFIERDIERRILIEKHAPAWKCEAIYAEILKEAVEDVAKEIAALAKKTCLLPQSDLDLSSQLLTSPSRAVIADKFNIEITGKELVCLRNLNWLNDETINFYMGMLDERQKRNQKSSYALPHHRARVHFFSSFFYTKLSENGYTYKSVSRWTKRAKINILDLDKIVLPVHVGQNHWCCAIINLAEKQFEYYDSLGGSNPTCLRNLRRYVEDEVKTYNPTKLQELKLDTWKEVHVKGIPQQNNGSDCGVFTLKFADYASEGLPFNFTHRDMPYFRRRIALEIKYQQVL